METVYPVLRGLAAAQLRRNPGVMTLQATNWGTKPTNVWPNQAKGTGRIETTSMPPRRPSVIPPKSNRPHKWNFLVT